MDTRYADRFRMPDSVADNAGAARTFTLAVGDSGGRGSRPRFGDAQRIQFDADTAIGTEVLDGGDRNATIP